MLYSHLRAKAHQVRDIASVDAAQTGVFVGNGSLHKEVSRKATFGWLFAFAVFHVGAKPTGFHPFFISLPKFQLYSPTGINFQISSLY